MPGTLLLESWFREKFRCYEATIEESEKAGSRWESNPGDLWLVQPALCHCAMTTGQPLALTILYMYCTGGTEMPQLHTWQPSKFLFIPT